MMLRRNLEKYISLQKIHTSEYCCGQLCDRKACPKNSGGSWHFLLHVVHLHLPQISLRLKVINCMCLALEYQENEKDSIFIKHYVFGLTCILVSQLQRHLNDSGYLVNIAFAHFVVLHGLCISTRQFPSIFLGGKIVTFSGIQILLPLFITFVLITLLYCRPVTSSGTETKTGCERNTFSQCLFVRLCIFHCLSVQ